MAIVRHDPPGRHTADRPFALIREIEQAEGYIASICFKTGPPTAIGAELEFTVHDADNPAKPLEIEQLAHALGDLAPTALREDSPHHPLRHGGTVTLEPGGQVEISSRPHPSLTALHVAMEAELDQLGGLLGQAGLRLGGAGIDPYRPPRRLLHNRRYDAMAAAYARGGGAGETMMCSTAGLQLCLDAGPETSLPARWAALHELGPILLAVFANSPYHAGRSTGWASARMRAWLEIDPAWADRVPAGEDPTESWVRYALGAPLLCVRRPDGPWPTPVGVTFADWIGGALPEPPTTDDLDYHLSTLFPPVRPRGYLEVRYLDTQPARDWFAPVAVLAALVADDATVGAARDLCAPAARRWTEAARCGLLDPVIGRAAPAVLDLAVRSLDRTGLPPSVCARVIDIVQERLR